MNMRQQHRREWGDKIRLHRLAANRPSSGPGDPGGPLTQEALAALLDVTQPTISAWESGAAAPAEWIRPRVASILGSHHAVMFAYTAVA